MEVRINPSFSIQNAIVTVETVEGQMLKSEITALKGSPAEPMSDSDLDSKFVSLASPTLKNDNKVDDALYALRNFEKLNDMNRFIDLF